VGGGGRPHWGGGCVLMSVANATRRRLLMSHLRLLMTAPAAAGRSWPYEWRIAAAPRRPAAGGGAGAGSAPRRIRPSHDISSSTCCRRVHVSLRLPARHSREIRRERSRCGPDLAAADARRTLTVSVRRTSAADMFHGARGPRGRCSATREAWSRRLGQPVSFAVQLAGARMAAERRRASERSLPPVALPQGGSDPHVKGLEAEDRR
jgi:hypothetical protein